MKLLEGLLDRFQDYPRVVEIRHSSWNDPEFYALLPRPGRWASATSISPSSAALIRPLRARHGSPSGTSACTGGATTPGLATIR